MMQNYTDSMTYTWVSFMHGAMVDGTVFKQGLRALYILKLLEE